MPYDMINRFILFAMNTLWFSTWNILYVIAKLDSVENWIWKLFPINLHVMHIERIVFCIMFSYGDWIYQFQFKIWINCFIFNFYCLFSLQIANILISIKWMRTWMTRCRRRTENIFFLFLSNYSSERNIHFWYQVRNSQNCFFIPFFSFHSIVFLLFLCFIWIMLKVRLQIVFWNYHQLCDCSKIVKTEQNEAKISKIVSTQSK